MTDVRVERSETLSRAEAVVWLQALSTALAQGGDVTLPVGGVTVGVHVPDKVRAEFEIEVTGDQVEIELQFSWRTTAVPPPSPPDDEPVELESTDRAWQV